MKKRNQMACCDNKLYHRPRVDIHEDDQGLHLLADLPGVAEKNLELNLEDRVLTLKAEVERDEGTEPLHREFRLCGYWRQFQLPQDVDQDRITARLDQGVLHLTVPQREEAKPKRIAITGK